MGPTLEELFSQTEQSYIHLPIAPDKEYPFVQVQALAPDGRPAHFYFGSEGEQTFQPVTTHGQALAAIILYLELQRDPYIVSDIRGGRLYVCSATKTAMFIDTSDTVPPVDRALTIKDLQPYFSTQHISLEYGLH